MRKVLVPALCASAAAVPAVAFAATDSTKTEAHVAPASATPNHELRVDARQKLQTALQRAKHERKLKLRAKARKRARARAERLRLPAPRQSSRPSRPASPAATRPRSTRRHVPRQVPVRLRHVGFGRRQWRSRRGPRGGAGPARGDPAAALRHVALARLRPVRTGAARGAKELEESDRRARHRAGPSSSSGR